jgi:hypothetical protein
MIVLQGIDIGRAVSGEPGVEAALELAAAVLGRVMT